MGYMKTTELKKLEVGLLALVVIVVLFNSFQIFQMNSMQMFGSVTVTQSTGISVIPSGTPEIYGAELGISYADVSPSNMQKADETIRILAMLDADIELTEPQLQRYIDTLYTLEGGISCEYCCGARSIIFENGDPACGCAHSYAMRGLAKYLITEHGDEYTNEEILEEVGKWKTLFFPDIMQGKADVLAQNGVELTYINIASNKYRGIETGTGGTMVGGC